MPPPTPSTAPARTVDGALSQSTRDFFDPKIDLIFWSFFDSILAPFWDRSGSLLGAFLASKSSQVPSKMPFQALSSSKMRFSRKPYKTNGFSMFFDPKIDPKTTQDRPKTHPRGSWKPLNFMLNFMFNFGPVWAPFWTLFWSLLGSKIGPKSMPKSFKNQVVPTYPQETAPRGPKSAPRPPQEAPRELEEAQKVPQEVQKVPQEAQKVPPETSKTLARVLKNTLEFKKELHQNSMKQNSV